MALLDAKPVNAKFGDENFDDIAENTWGFSTTTVYIDKNLLVGTVEGLGYKKYCQAPIFTHWDNDGDYQVYAQNNKCFGGYSVTLGYVLEGNYTMLGSSSRFNGASPSCWWEWQNVVFNKTSSCSITGTATWYKP